LKLAHLSDTELRKWSKDYGYEEGSRDAMLEQLNGHADGILDTNRKDIKNLPMAPPPFTLSQIQAAIPRHCFKRSLTHSLYYLALDLAQIALLAWAAHTYIGKTDMLPEWSPYILWPIYTFCQGTVMTGVWVLAHECGHQSFSDSEFWNNTFGTVLHSLLLVPYHSWRITHKRHHENTGSCENDEVFAPSTRTDWGTDMLRETPIAQAVGIVIMLTVGWMPGYLIFNITGPSKYRGKNANHFSPTAVFFKPEEYWLIVQSDLGFFSVLAAVIYSVYVFGMGNVWAFYLAPLMVTNYHLVLITYLQHTATYIPHFRGKEWNFLRGALCTVDRSFGFIMNHYLHHITDTHVCHHLFSKMPFYHAVEATEAIKKVCGEYYLKDDTPIASACYNSFKQCQFVEDEGSIVWYKNVR
jgi:omega-6 fatty acid desaturase (delta-12 desaturase)